MQDVFFVSNSFNTTGQVAWKISVPILTEGTNVLRSHGFVLRDAVSDPQRLSKVLDNSKLKRHKAQIKGKS